MAGSALRLEDAPGGFLRRIGLSEQSGDKSTHAHNRTNPD